MYDDVAVETIPSEILCEIFQHLCDSDNAISLHVLDNNSCSDEFPWAVGQVCKRWREIFLSCPRLWTSLFLQHCSNSDISEDYLREMSRRTLLYLERSKQLPLTITVHTLSFGDNDNFPRTTWKLLLSCSERWARVHLSLCHETSSLLDLLKCKMPIVKSLWIWVERHGLADFQLCNPFTAAPCLTELELPGWLGEWVLKFPWSQLTKVKIPTTNFGDVIDNNNLETILSQLRNVEELRMDKMSIWRRNVPDWCSSPIRLPSLRFLSVPVYSPFTILRRLEAPLLEHLWVDWCPMFDREEGYHSVIFAEDLSYFIRHPSCRIRRLTLDDCESILSSDLMKLLSSIEKLCIKTATFQRGSFLVGHITQINDGVCLPNLRELEVTCFQGRDDAEMLMTAMSGLLETRSEESRLISVRREDVPLEPTMARLSMSFKRPALGLCENV